MRRYSQTEINLRVKHLYRHLIASDSLINAIRIARGVLDSCKVEKKRRKELER